MRFIKGRSTRVLILFFNWFAEVNPSVDNLYSVARENLVSEERHSNREEDDKALKEQTEILEMDDIVDYDSEDSTPNHDSKGSHLNHAAASAPPPTMKGPENSQEIIVIDD